ncbi:MAG: MBL fold metallo-hydrolase [Phycisphaerae bacterium]
MKRSGPITVIVLGSGTSAGVPMIGCRCAVCHSSDPKDQRGRCSIAVQYDGHSYLVDTGPELRMQAIANQLDAIDAVVYTHGHADHIFGLDDVRRYNTIAGGPLPVYAQADTLGILQTAFPYAFVPASPVDGMYRPELVPHHIDGPFNLGGRTWTPVPLIHGKGEVLGFRIGDFAYCTDCSAISPTSRDLLRRLDVLIIDALRPYPHPSHLSFPQALSIIADLQPKRAFFTHLTHDVCHREIEAQLPPGVEACYDGLRLMIA